MGWFWDSKDSASNGDPYNKLDPSLRDFLSKESASQNEDDASARGRTSSSEPPATAPTTYRSKAGLPVSEAPQASPAASASQAETPVVPAESLYQDGRYAHLWKGYRSLAELEEVGKSDQDRMSDIAQGWKQRKAEIARAALENCVELQIGIQECFRRGNLSDKMTMCRAENRAFNRCFEMQSRFLKALGYIAFERSPQEEERIQMHADKLYHDMLEREQVVKEAKEKGLEEPELPALIQAQKVTEALGQDSAWARARSRAQEAGMNLNMSSFTEEKQAQIKEKIKGMSKDQQELELQLIAAESRASLEWAERFTSEMEAEKLHRRDRRERGKESFGDTIKRWWGWEQ